MGGDKGLVENQGHNIFHGAEIGTMSLVFRWFSGFLHITTTRFDEFVNRLGFVLHWAVFVGAVEGHDKGIIPKIAQQTNSR